MNCYLHPQLPAVGTCTNCGRAVCQSCSVNAAGKIVCQKCMSSGNFTNVQKKPYNPLSIVSIILSVLGLCGGTIFGGSGAIIGYIARNQILQSETKQEGLTLANVGLWLGVSEVVFAIVIGLIIFVLFLLGFGSSLLLLIPFNWNTY